MLGQIFDIQRFCTHDGPGIRTTVFYQGCPLRCEWCHNPESRQSKPVLAFYATKCIHCGRCFEVCPNNALTTTEQHIDRKLCRVCGKCAEACPTEALQLIGRSATVEEIVATVLRDEPFYSTSGGGCTLSGGEPFFQPEFTMELLAALKQNNISTAIETCGAVAWDRIERALPLVDLFLYDCKILDQDKHKQYCKADNALILDNARKIADLGKPITLRTPIIPTINDTPEDIKQLGEFMQSLPPHVTLELMPYHAIGSGKYIAIGLPEPLPGVPSPENIDYVIAQLAEMGVAASLS